MPIWIVASDLVEARLDRAVVARLDSIAWRRSVPPSAVRSRTRAAHMRMRTGELAAVRLQTSATRLA
jgi:hypothetical protein